VLYQRQSLFFRNVSSQLTITNDLVACLAFDVAASAVSMGMNAEARLDSRSKAYTTRIFLQRGIIEALLDGQGARPAIALFGRVGSVL
jgi:hypothetical protein